MSGEDMTISFVQVRAKNLDTIDSDGILTFDEIDGVPQTNQIRDRNLYAVIGDGDQTFEDGEVGHLLSDMGYGGRVTTLEANATPDDPIAITGHGRINNGNIGDLTRAVRLRDDGFGLDNGPDGEGTARYLNSGDSLTFTSNEGVIKILSFTAQIRGDAGTTRIVLDIDGDIIRTADGQSAGRAKRSEQTDDRLAVIDGIVDGDELVIDVAARTITVNGVAATATDAFFDALEAADAQAITIGSDSEPVALQNLVITTGADDGTPNTPPVASDGAFAGFEDTPLTGTLDATDADGDDLTFSLLSGPANGSVTIEENGDFTFTPATNLSGEETFTYLVSDGDGTASATVTLSVEAVADAPLLTAQNAQGDEDTLIPLNLSAALADLDGSESLTNIRLVIPDGAQLTAGQVQPDGSVLLTSSDLVGLQLRPPTDFSGQLTLTFQATATEASNGDTATASIDFTVDVAEVNDPPSPNAFFGPNFVFADQLFEFTFGADAFVDDDNGQPLTYSATLADGSPLPAWLSFDPVTRTFSGTPDSDDAGVVQIRVTASEPDGQQSSAVFPITTLDGNVIDGTPQADTIDGTENGDLIRGFADRDSLDGGVGADLIEGGDGFDTIFGGTGSDALFGDEGNDRLRGEAGDDVLVGGEGNDNLDGDAGDDFLFGGAGNDTLSNDFGDDVIFGGDGDDTLFSTGAGGGDTDIIDAGAGDDFLRITAVPDDLSVTLGEGMDTISINVAAPQGGRFFRVTDFDTGPGGDQFFLFFQTVNGGGPIGFDGSENPFTEYLRLVQDGDDALLQFDRDGDGTAFDYQTLVLLENTQAASFTSDNFDPGYNPTGGPTPGEIITGTEDRDIIEGTVGDDQIFGLGGNDNIRAGAGNDFIDGGLGNDDLFGTFGNNTIIGGAGSDNIRGAAGDDLIEGGDDGDVINGGSGGRDTIFGGAGDDQITIGGLTTIRQDIDAGSGDDVIFVPQAQAILSSTEGEGIFITLGEGADLFDIGTSLSLPTGQIVITDFETGATGDAVDYGDLFVNAIGYDGVTNPFSNGFLRVSDTVDGAILEYDRDGTATGFDYQTLVLLQGIASADLAPENFIPDFSIDGSPSPQSTIVGTGNSDTIEGTSGGDLIQGLDGADRLDGGFGSDTLEGGAANDRLVGFLGGDVLRGDGGNDTLLGDQGDDQLFGGDNNDRLDGGAGNDFIDAGDGDDLILSSGGDDTLIGGEGNDNITTSGGQTVDAGLGDDTVDANAFGGSVTVTLGAGSDFLSAESPLNPSQAVITVTDFETGPGGDVFDVETLVNGILSTAFDGVSNPFAAGLLRLLQDGSDTILGVDAGGPTSAGQVDYRELVRFENTLVDDFTVDNFNLSLNPDGSGVLGQDNDGSNGSDTLPGSFGDDTLSGLDGNDLLQGGNGNDVLVGGAGLDTLEGGFGRDQLDGGANDDVLIGGDEADQLTGGDGADQFVYQFAFDGADTITDFEAGIDQFVLDRGGFGLSVDPDIVIGANPAAQSTNAAILYDTASGAISIDLDGTGTDAPDVLVTLTSVPTLTESDFFFT